MTWIVFFLKFAVTFFGVMGAMNGSSATIEPLPMEITSDKVNLSPHIACTNVRRTSPSLQGSEENFSFSDIHQPSIIWQRNKELYLDYRFNHQVLWCRIELLNKTTEHYRWHLVLDNTRLNFVNFYWQTGTNHAMPELTYYSGDHRRSSVKHANTYLATALPTFTFTLHPNRSGYLYFAIDTDSVTWLQPTLYNAEGYAAMVNQRQFWQWLYAVVVIGCILFYYTFTSFRFDKIALYYTLTVVSGLFYLYSFWGDASHWFGNLSGDNKNDLLYLLNLSYQFFALWFIKTHLRTTEFFPWLARLLVLQIVVIIIAGLLIFCYFESNQNRVLVCSIAALMTGVTLVIGAYKAIRVGLRWAWGLMIAWATIALSGAVFALTFMGSIPFYPFTTKLMLWAFPVDFIALSIANFFRHRHIRDELQQLRKSINRLSDNRRLSMAARSVVIDSPSLHSNSIPQKLNAVETGYPNKVNHEHQFQNNQSDTKVSSAPKCLQDVDCDEKLKQLIDYFERDKAFCHEDMSLAHIAKVIDLRQDQVSALLNHTLGTSLSTFTNEYRVQEAKKLLLDFPDETILNIAMRCGFNSRDDFNRVFSSHTSMSAMAFRKKNSLPVIG